MKNKAIILCALAGIFAFGIFAAWYGTARAVILKQVYDTVSGKGDGLDDDNYAKDIVVERGTSPSAYVIGHTTNGYGGSFPDLVKYDSVGVVGPKVIVSDGNESIALNYVGSNAYVYVVGGDNYKSGGIYKYDSSLSLIASTSTHSIAPLDFNYEIYDNYGDVNSVAVDSTGVYVAGTYVHCLVRATCDPDIAGQTNSDIWFMKFDLGLTQEIGNHRFYDSGANNYDAANGVAVDAFQNAYVVGRSGSNTWTVVRFNSGGGTTLVDALIVPYHGAKTVAVDTASGYIYVAGNERNFDSGPPQAIPRIRLVKYASSSPWAGWVATSSPQGQSSATGVALDKFGSAYVSLDSPVGSVEGGVQKFNSSGKLLFTSTSSLMCAESVAVDDNLNLYMTGDDTCGISGAKYRTKKISQMCNGTSSLTNYEIPWTDDPIIPNVTKIRATHITELRDWIDNRWNDATSTPKPYSWGNFPPLGSSDAEIIPGQTKIRAGHINELRDILSRTFSACNATAPGLAGVDATTTISASQIRGLRDFTKSVPSLPQ